MISNYLLRGRARDGVPRHHPHPRGGADPGPLRLAPGQHAQAAAGAPVSNTHNWS